MPSSAVQVIDIDTTAVSCSEVLLDSCNKLIAPVSTPSHVENLEGFRILLTTPDGKSKVELTMSHGTARIIVGRYSRLKKRTKAFKLPELSKFVDKFSLRDPEVSSSHAQFTFSIPKSQCINTCQVFLQDLNSRNGTAVNKTVLEPLGTPRLLRVGDNIRFGSTKLVFSNVLLNGLEIPIASPLENITNLSHVSQSSRRNVSSQLSQSSKLSQSTEPEILDAECSVNQNHVAIPPAPQLHTKAKRDTAKVVGSSKGITKTQSLCVDVEQRKEPTLTILGENNLQVGSADTTATEVEVSMDKSATIVESRERVSKVIVSPKTTTRKVPTTTRSVPQRTSASKSCIVCGIDISILDPDQQTMHVNICLDYSKQRTNGSTRVLDDFVDDEFISNHPRTKNKSTKAKKSRPILQKSKSLPPVLPSSQSSAKDHSEKNTKSNLDSNNADDNTDDNVTSAPKKKQVRCVVCVKDMSHLTRKQQNAHVNQCCERFSAIERDHKLGKTLLCKLGKPPAPVANSNLGKAKYNFRNISEIEAFVTKRILSPEQEDFAATDEGRAAVARIIGLRNNHAFGSIEESQVRLGQIEIALEKLMHEKVLLQDRIQRSKNLQEVQREVVQDDGVLSESQIKKATEAAFGKAACSSPVATLPSSKFAKRPQVTTDVDETDSNKFMWNNASRSSPVSRREPMKEVSNDQIPLSCLVSCDSIIFHAPREMTQVFPTWESNASFLVQQSAEDLNAALVNVTNEIESNCDPVTQRCCKYLSRVITALLHRTSSGNSCKDDASQSRNSCKDDASQSRNSCKDDATESRNSCKDDASQSRNSCKDDASQVSKSGTESSISATKASLSLGQECVQVGVTVRTESASKSKATRKRFLDESQGSGMSTVDGFTESDGSMVQHVQDNLVNSENSEGSSENQLCKESDENKSLQLLSQQNNKLNLSEASSYIESCNIQATESRKKLRRDSMDSIETCDEEASRADSEIVDMHVNDESSDLSDCEISRLGINSNTTSKSKFHHSPQDCITHQSVSKQESAKSLETDQNQLGTKVGTSFAKRVTTRNNIQVSTSSNNGPSIDLSQDAPESPMSPLQVSGSDDNDDVKYVSCDENTADEVVDESDSSNNNEDEGDNEDGDDGNNDSVDVADVFEVIRKNEKLYEMILLHEVVEVRDVQRVLKDAGLSVSLVVLRNMLDQHGVVVKHIVAPRKKRKRSKSSQAT